MTNTIAKAFPDRVHTVGVDLFPRKDDIESLQEWLPFGGIFELEEWKSWDIKTAKAAAERSRIAFSNAIAGQKQVFVTAGLGGVTSSAGVPVLVEVARGQGCEIYGVFCKPMEWEGFTLTTRCEQALAKIREFMTVLTVISQQNLIEFASKKATVGDFRVSTNEIMIRLLEGQLNGADPSPIRTRKRI